MLGPADLTARLRFVSRAAAVLVTALGIAVLLGWVFDLAPLKSALPGQITMKANTALSFVLLGIALLTLGPGTARGAPRLAGLVCAATATAVGAATLTEYVLGVDLGIDELLFRDPTASVTASPGSIAPTTAINFMLFGIAFFALDRGTRAGLVTGPALAALLVVWVTILGYAYGERGVFGVGPYVAMAVNTAAAFLVLGVGTLASRPQSNVVQLFLGDTAGGIVARRVVVAASLVLSVFGWLRLAGQQLGLYDTGYGLAIMVATSSVIIILLVSRSAFALDRAEDRLRHFAGELAQVGKHRDEFLSLMAHELRSPVAAISLLADGLSAAPGLDPRERRAAVALRGQARALAQIAEDVLAIGTLEARTARLDLREVDLREVAAAAAEEVGERVILRVPDEPLLVKADRGRARQVVTNLLSNAVKYSAADRPVRLSLLRDGPGARIEVSDEGVGLTEDDIRRLFRKYGRVGDERTAAVAGVGLGLYLVRLIVEAHGGAVSATSPGPGHGSTFVVSFPFAPVAAGGAPA